MIEAKCPRLTRHEPHRWDDDEKYEPAPRYHCTGVPMTTAKLDRMIEEELESGRLSQDQLDAVSIPDMVNHPPHYTHGTIEPIDVIHDWGLGFDLGQVIKYVARHEHKGTALQDLEKAAWYLNDEIEQRKKNA